MRTTNSAARGGPLAALLFLLVLVFSLSVLAGETIRMEQTLEWAELEEGMTGLPEKVDLKLLLSGLGPIGGFPIDCILIIDTSSTADLSSAKSFAFDLIDQFEAGDRIGLVSYASTASLDIPLTESRLAVKTAVSDLKNNGKSALGDAMQIARRELTLVGREDAILVEILLSDGQSNAGIEPGVEGVIAAESGIRVISVGIGSLINRTLLQSFATETDGLYFARPSSDALVKIADHLEIEVVATDVRITKELPKGLRLVSSSPSAVQVNVDSNGVTSAMWRVSDLLIDQEIEITLEIEATEVGAWADDLDLMVTYTDFRGVEGSELFPPPNWPPLAEFKIDPLRPTTAEIVTFTDLSEDANEGGRIVAWAWEFDDEGESSIQHPEFRFTERGEYTVRLVVTDDRGSESIAYEQVVVVGNAAPVAGFVIRDPETMAEIERPHLGVTALLDASMSYDLDGDIDRYLWDLNGDGTADIDTSSSEFEAAFEMPGEIDVTLWVVDDEGKIEEFSRAIDILPSVLAERFIETCMPDDVTMPEGVSHVSIIISVNTVLNGLTVSETIPEGWTFGEVDNDSATKPRLNGQKVEWLFLEKFMNDGINEQREIKYTLTAPADVTDDLTRSNVHGVVGSSSPRVSLTISGDDRVSVRDQFPVPVVISRWNSLDATLDPCLGELIAYDQIQYATSLWISGGEVPSTAGAIIDLKVMQDLIAYWLTGSSVHDPLP